MYVNDFSVFTFFMWVGQEAEREGETGWSQGTGKDRVRHTETQKRWVERTRGRKDWTMPHSGGQKTYVGRWRQKLGSQVSAGIENPGAPGWLSL